MSKKKITIALAGNPNSGKTTLFNALTGAHQHVGNYPGVTVEKKIGHLRLSADLKLEFIDLPGIYGLSAFALDEVVTRNFLLEERPDLIINVVDASNIERNLYFTTQLMELEIPMIMALNMVDTAKEMGLAIKHDELEKFLGLKVIETIGHREEGLQDLVHFLRSYADGKARLPQAKVISLGLDIDETVKELAEILPLNSQHPLRWLSIKLIENDEKIVHDLFAQMKSEAQMKVKNRLQHIASHIENTLGDTAENIIADQRYGHISFIMKKCVSQIPSLQKNITEKIDQWVLHRLAGPLLLLLILWLFYFVVFTASERPVEWLSSFFASTHDVVSSWFPDGPLWDILHSLVVSGIIDGVGGVLGFTPLIMMMFLFISVLEDSGYMARIAFLLDRVLRFFGMHGNSILAYVVSGGIAGGCAVPGIMATRTLRDPKERLATILTAPFMNCGAKLPVYTLLIAAFFTTHQSTMMFAITLLSWFFALMVAGILRKTVLRGESTPFVMELPPYRRPTLKGVIIHMWERTFMYIRKAGTLILGASVIMWLIMTFPMLDVKQAPYNALTDEAKAQAKLEYSLAGRVGKGLEQVTRPLTGFDWQTNIALIGGFAAKEVVVSTLGVAYSLGEVDAENSTNLQMKLASNPDWSPAKAFALILFIMLYVPCISVVSIMFRETGSWKIVLFSVSYTTTMATLVSAAFYQLTRFFA